GPACAFAVTWIIENEYADAKAIDPAAQALAAMAEVTRVAVAVEHSALLGRPAGRFGPPGMDASTSRAGQVQVLDTQTGRRRLPILGVRDGPKDEGTHKRAQHSSKPYLSCVPRTQGIIARAGRSRPILAAPALRMTTAASRPSGRRG